MADKYTRNPSKSILPYRLIAELDADTDIAAVPTTVKKVEWDSVGDVLEIEFNDDIIDLSAAEIAMDAVISTHNGTPLENSTITVTTLSGDVHNFNTTNFLEARRVRVDSDGDGHKITGMVAGAHGQRIIFINTGLKNIKWSYEDALSSPVNRCITPNLGDYTLLEGGQCAWEYDGDDQRWRLLWSA